MGVCSVPGCNVTGRTSHKSIKYAKVNKFFEGLILQFLLIGLFIQVHPNARGKLYKVTPERRRVWADLLKLDEDDENLFVCARHFSLVQYNEVRLAKACTYNVLVHGARPDLAIPGCEDDPTLPVFAEIQREP